MKKQENGSANVPPDLKAYIEKLESTGPLRESILRSAIQTLNLTKGSKGLDVGCGIGLQSLLLAEEVGPHGHITELDITPAFVHYANRNVYENARCAEVYAKLEFPGTYYLAYRDLPQIISEHVKVKTALDFGCGAGYHDKRQ